jgi:hypothetical protein
MSKLVSATYGGIFLPLYKPSIANTGAGQMTALWLAAGLPAAGVAATSFVVPTDDLTGSWPIPTSGALDFYLINAMIAGVTINLWIIYDRIGQMGGLLHNNVAVQTAGVTISSQAAAGRCAADGSDVEWFTEIYTDLGITSATVTVNVVNGLGTATSVTLAIGGASPLNRASRIQQILPGASASIAQVTSVQLSASSATAGNFGITARKRLVQLPQMIANISAPGDFASMGSAWIADAACLEIVCINSTTSTGIVQGGLKVGSA